MNKIDWLLDQLKVYFESEATGHDYWHALRVYKTAWQLVKKREARSELFKRLPCFMMWRTGNWTRINKKREEPK